MASVAARLGGGDPGGYAAARPKAVAKQEGGGEAGGRGGGEVCRAAHLMVPCRWLPRSRPAADVAVANTGLRDARGAGEGGAAGQHTRAAARHGDPRARPDAPARGSTRTISAQDQARWRLPDGADDESAEAHHACATSRAFWSVRESASGPTHAVVIDAEEARRSRAGAPSQRRPDDARRAAGPRGDAGGGGGVVLDKAPGSLVRPEVSGEPGVAASAYVRGGASKAVARS